MGIHRRKGFCKYDGCRGGSIEIEIVSASYTGGFGFTVTGITTKTNVYWLRMILVDYNLFLTWGEEMSSSVVFERGPLPNGEVKVTGGCYWRKLI